MLPILPWDMPRIDFRLGADLSPDVLSSLRAVLRSGVEHGRVTLTDAACEEYLRLLLMIPSGPLVCRFEIPGEPTAKGAVKNSVFSRGGGGFGIRKFTPRKTAQALSDARTFASQAMGGRPPAGGPLLLVLRAFRAKGIPSTKKGISEAMAGLLRPTTRPDTDNYAKLVKDACTGIVWTDDAVVVTDHVEKWFSNRPRIEVEVREWIPREVPT